jgi:hypothetical protein
MSANNTDETVWDFIFGVLVPVGLVAAVVFGFFYVMAHYS